MKAYIIDEAYKELRNRCLYWKDNYRKTKGAIAERDIIIRNLRGLYTKWKNKYANMAVLTNYALQDFLDMMKEVDLIMCLENTPHRVYKFVKFCKKTLAELITYVKALRKSQGIIFQVNS